MDDKFSSLKTVEDLGILNGHAFEEYLAQLFSDLGYKVEKTPGSGDYGADLVLGAKGIRIVVQAKQHSADVGFDAVKEAHFAKTYYKADEAWVVCSGKFTRQAHEAAKESGVVLHDKSWLGEMLKLHQSGGKMIKARASGPKDRQGTKAVKRTRYQATFDRIARLREDERIRIAKMPRASRIRALGLGGEWDRLQHLKKEYEERIAQIKLLNVADSDLREARRIAERAAEKVNAAKKREESLKLEIDEFDLGGLIGRSKRARQAQELQSRYSAQQQETSVLQDMLHEAIIAENREKEALEMRKQQMQALAKEKSDLEAEVKSLQQRLEKALREQKIRNVYDDVMKEFKDWHRVDPEEALKAYSSIEKVKARALELDNV